MRVTVVGGGPAGLYAALLIKTALPAILIDVYEQNPPGATYGFGIVLAERGLDYLRRAHATTAAAIEAASYVIRHRLVSHRSQTVFVEEEAYGFAIARLRLLEILAGACERAGVSLRYSAHIDHLPKSSEVDLIIGADGVHSVVRRSEEAAFGTSMRTLTNRLAWYGTKQHVAYPLLAFKSNPRGHFVGVAYPYSEHDSTFVAECDATAWEAGGLGTLTEADRTSFAESLFREELGGHSLISNASAWKALPVVRNRAWSVGNCVLIGDALQSAHPSIGSGTRIAMEDAIELAAAVVRNAPNVAQALAAFEAVRRPARQKLLDATDRSIDWYESIGARIDALEPVPLVFDFLTRTGRINEERLLTSFPRFMERYADEWGAFASAPSR